MTADSLVTSYLRLVDRACHTDSVTGATLLHLLRLGVEVYQDATERERTQIRAFLVSLSGLHLDPTVVLQ